MAILDPSWTFLAFLFLPKQSSKYIFYLLGPFIVDTTTFGKIGAW